MGSAQAQEIILDFIKERGIEEKIRRKGEVKSKQNVAIEMLNRGFQVSKIADIVKMPINWVEKEIKNANT